MESDVNDVDMSGTLVVNDLIIGIPVNVGFTLKEICHWHLSEDSFTQCSFNIHIPRKIRYTQMASGVLYMEYL